MVGVGESRAAAEALAADLARFPQGTMRGDRQAALEGLDRSLEDALAGEFAIGAKHLAQAVEGAARFAAGKGRGGRFDDL